MLSRTVLLSAVWLTFTMLEKKFTACFYLVEPCECKAEQVTASAVTEECLSYEMELASKWRVLVAKCVLAVTIGFALVLFVVAFCVFKMPCCRCCLNRVSACDCMCSCIDSAEAMQQKEAILMLLNTRPKLCKSTIFTLESQGVLETVYEIVSAKIKRQQRGKQYMANFFLADEGKCAEKLPLLHMPPKEERGDNAGTVASLSNDSLIKLRGLMTAGEFEKLKAIMNVKEEPPSPNQVFVPVPRYSIDESEPKHILSV